MSDDRSHEFTRGLYGWITHTDLSSTDPVATREWCTKVLGWTFQPPFPTPGGDYHLFADERPRLWDLVIEGFPAYAKYQRKAKRDLPVVVLHPI